MKLTSKSLLVVLILLSVGNLCAVDSDEECLAQDRDYYSTDKIHSRVDHFLKNIRYNSKTAKKKVVIKKDIHNINRYSQEAVQEIDRKLNLIEVFLKAKINGSRCPLERQKVLLEGELHKIGLHPFYEERNLDSLVQVVIFWEESFCNI